MPPPSSRRSSRALASRLTKPSIRPRRHAEVTQRWPRSTFSFVGEGPAPAGVSRRDWWSGGYGRAGSAVGEGSTAGAPGSRGRMEVVHTDEDSRGTPPGPAPTMPAAWRGG